MMYPSVCMYACARVALFYRSGFTETIVFDRHGRSIVVKISLELRINTFMDLFLTKRIK